MTPGFQSLLLIASGVFFALLFILNVLLKTLRGRHKLGFFDLLLAFVTTTLVILALVYDNLEPETGQPIVRTGALAIAGVMIVVGVLIMLAESRRVQKLKGSRGLLGLWAGVLMLLSVFTVPRLSVNLMVTPPAPVLVAANGSPATTDSPNADSTDDPAPRASATTAPTLTATRTVAPTATRTPRPTASPTETRERFSYSTRTPEPTATLVNPCLVLVKYNLRLRTAPNGEADTLLTIPFETNVTAYGRNDESTWWYVTYEDQSGWIDGGYAEASSACADLPIEDD